MKEKNKKIIVAILMIISIINIICLIYGYFSSLAGNHSFNESLSPSTNITIFFPIILILQIASIVLLISLLKKELNTKKQKVKLFCIIAVIVITFFIPVKGTHSIKYTYPNNNNLNPADLLNSMGSTTHINSYKNLYGLTLKNDKNTSVGMEIY